MQAKYYTSKDKWKQLERGKKKESRQFRAKKHVSEVK